MPNQPAVFAEDLRYRYGQRTALDGVSFEVGKGECFGLLGPNGSGKTTLFRLVGTLLAMQDGGLKLAGTDVRREPHAIRRKLGIVFQHTSLDVKLTVAENLRHQGHLYGLSGPALEKRSAELLELFRLNERRDELVETLSGGLKRRLEVAKSLLHRPPVLLLDEPTSGFDPTARREFWDMLAKVNQDEGTTVLVTTHLMEEAERCSRIMILDRGKCVAKGSPAEQKASLGEQNITVTLVRDADVEEVAGKLHNALSVLVQSSGQVLRLDTARQTPAELGPMLARVLELTGTKAETIALSQPTLEDVFFAKTGHPFDAGHLDQQELQEAA